MVQDMITQTKTCKVRWEPDDILDDVFQVIIIIIIIIMIPCLCLPFLLNNITDI